MTNPPLPNGPDDQAMTEYISRTYPETDVFEMDGATFLSFDPENHWPAYATILTKDDHNPASKLSRPGVYRLNIGVDKQTFERLAGGVEDPDMAEFRSDPPPPRLRQAALDLHPEPDGGDLRRRREAAARPRLRSTGGRSCPAPRVS